MHCAGDLGILYWFVVVIVCAHNTVVPLHVVEDCVQLLLHAVHVATEGPVVPEVGDEEAASCRGGRGSGGARGWGGDQQLQMLLGRGI